MFFLTFGILYIKYSNVHMVNAHWITSMYDIQSIRHPNIYKLRTTFIIHQWSTNECAVLVTVIKCGCFVILSSGAVYVWRFLVCQYDTKINEDDSSICRTQGVYQSTIYQYLPK